METLTRSAILEADDLATEQLDVPEWGGSVTVRTMTGAERDAFEAKIMAAGRGAGGMDIRGLKVRLVQLTLVDDEGGLLFDADDADMLNGKSALAIDRVFGVAQRLNGLSADDVEDLVGN